MEQALADGEDYELLFTLAESRVEKLQAAWKKQFPKLRLTMIGRLTDGLAMDLDGWEHFA